MEVATAWCGRPHTMYVPHSLSVVALGEEVFRETWRRKFPRPGSAKHREYVEENRRRYELPRYDEEPSCAGCALFRAKEARAVAALACGDTEGQRRR